MSDAEKLKLQRAKCSLTSGLSSSGVLDECNVRTQSCGMM